MGAPNAENLNGDSFHTRQGKGMKTVFLIRHAESDENRRRASLTKCFEQITTGAIPSTEDLEASFELLNVPAQLNSDVSNIGAQQIKHMGELLRESKFLEENKVQLVVHSPLLRARQTCEGLLGCVASPLRKPSCVARVEELDFLVERQPQEVPQEFILKDVAPTSSSFNRRIMQFEQWLAKQPEEIITVVGHSLHFKTMLNVPFKFKNCEVWVCQFDPKQRIPDETKPATNTNSLLPEIPRAMQQMNNVFQNMREPAVSPWSGLKRVHSCEISRETNS
jgi:broad specificity phosphatase PhoE